LRLGGTDIAVSGRERHRSNPFEQWRRACTFAVTISGAVPLAIPVSVAKHGYWRRSSHDIAESGAIQRPACYG